MPAVKFFACLDLDQNPSFLDRHYLNLNQDNHIFKNENKENQGGGTIKKGTAFDMITRGVKSAFDSL